MLIQEVLHKNEKDRLRIDDILEKPFLQEHLQRYAEELQEAKFTYKYAEDFILENVQQKTLNIDML